MKGKNTAECVGFTPLVNTKCVACVHACVCVCVCVCVCFLVETIECFNIVIHEQ